MTGVEPILQTHALLAPGSVLSNQHPKNFDSVESRRSRASQRRMTPARRLYYFLGLPVLRALIRLLASTYRVEAVIGAGHIEPFIKDRKVCAPCYWHQHHVVGSTLIRSWVRRGFKACFLVSGSVDGEVPERIARAWGAEVIRGSANESGALALRDMQRMMNNGYSIVTTADGPRGPKYEFKAGAILMARIAGVPIIPIACAAEHAWYLNRWDDFMVPKPFSRIVLAVGQPHPIPADVRLDQLEPHRMAVQEAVMSLMRESEQALEKVHA
ncbi:MAG: lysophospholipid acyltransferase family protein [Gammaproteobacteria bacterium]|nr:lysophospholipid acyltransferase family protein [Gammaproteobacteria bacterium]NND46838.1 lysophospholipid acyltransferase family protein [Woeseiaceae bacterium]